MIDILSFNKSLNMKQVQGYFNDDNHSIVVNGCFSQISTSRSTQEGVFLSNFKPQYVPQLNKETLIGHWTNKESYRRLVQDKGSRQSQVKWLSEGDLVGNSIVNWEKFKMLLSAKSQSIPVKRFKQTITLHDFLCRIGKKQVDSFPSAGKLLKLWYLLKLQI